MKFALAYYLILIYATVMLKPIIPLAQDAIVHCFAEAYHEATVHAMEGNDHVEKEMADSGADDDATKNQKADKTEQTIHETGVVYVFHFINLYSLVCNYPFINAPLSNTYIAFINPPPRVVS